RVARFRDDDGNLVPTGRRSLLGVRGNLVTPVGLNGAARLVPGGVALTGIGVKNHRPPGQGLASELDLPLDGEHPFQMRWAAASQPAQPARRDPEYNRIARPRRDATYHALSPEITSTSPRRRGAGLQPGRAGDLIRPIVS